MSTISPTLTRRLAREVGAHGLAFLDCPVSGTSAMVARGDCTIFVGGDPARVEACRPQRRVVAPGGVCLSSLETNEALGSTGTRAGRLRGLHVNPL